MYDEEREVVVLTYGSNLIKAGICGNDSPSIVIDV